MKTTKTLSVALLIAMISTIGLTSVSAYGQGSGQGQNLTAEEKAEVQNMTQEERQAYMEEKGVEMQDEDGDGIPNKDDEDYVKPQDGTNKPENAGSGSGSMNGNSDMDRGNGNSALKAKYKNTYEEKYGDAISRMNDDQLNTFITKIDDIAEKVNTGDYSDETKEKFNAMLDALREIAEDNLASTEDDLLDGLFD